MSKAKFVIYRRVSTREQGKSGLGLASQKSLLAHYLNGYEVVAEFEEVASAKSIEGRPQLQQAIKLCVDNGYHLAVAKVDRLSRKTEDALKIWGQLDQRLFCANLPMSAGDLTDKFMLTMFMAIADRERELISIRTKQALQAKRERDGAWFTPDMSNLDQIAREKGAATMRAKAIEANAQAAFAAKMLREAGYSFGRIAEKLNENEYKTPRGKDFKAMTVKRMLDRVTV